jgi:UDP-2,3-diacylglucosamine pyrophosphatase LpxH
MSEPGFRTIFISDVHLGTRGCRAAECWQFLKHARCQRLYLVGDIVDLWVLKGRVHWPATHNQVVRRILKLARKGTHVVFIPGNHDEALRQYVGLDLGGVVLAKQAVHRTADGRQWLVTHGDEYDLVVQNQRMLSIIGGWAYDHLVTLNRVVNAARRLVGLRAWSFSATIKKKVKGACTFISNFEHALGAEALRRGMDGVICGHIHQPALRQIDADESGQRKVWYANCGDWVERASALVEHDDGRMEVLDVQAWLDALGIDAEAEAANARREADTEPLVDGGLGELLPWPGIDAIADAGTGRGSMVAS